MLIDIEQLLHKIKANRRREIFETVSDMKHRHTTCVNVRLRASAILIVYSKELCLKIIHPVLSKDKLKTGIRPNLPVSSNPSPYYQAYLP